MFQKTVSKQLKFNWIWLCSSFMLCSVVYVAKIGLQVDFIVRVESEYSSNISTPHTIGSDIKSDSYSLEISTKGSVSAQTLSGIFK